MHEPISPVYPSTAWYEDVIDADAVAAFALATNDPNPRYLQGRSVPPLYSATFILDSMWESQRLGISHENIDGSSRGVHGQHDVLVLKPLHQGMAVRWRSATLSAHRNKGGVMVVQRIVVTDGSGSLHVDHRWSNFYPGGTITEDVGPAPADHPFPDDARAHLCGCKIVPVERDQGFRYAGASGDRVPHSMSDLQAQREGYPSKILQGMCTFALASGAVVDTIAGGEPDRIRRLAVRFARPAFPRKDLEVRVYRIDPARFAFEAVQDDVAVLRHGRVEVAPGA